MVDESRLIQLLIHGSRLNKQIRSRVHENILLSSIMIHGEKNRPITLHLKTIGTLRVVEAE